MIFGISSLSTRPFRSVTAAAAVAAVLCAGGAATASAPAPSGPAPTGADDVTGRFAALERRHDARLGVVAIDTGTGERVEYRAGERFAHASTMKVLVAGLVLEEYSDRELERRVRWSEADLVAHSPITELYVETGMTVRQLIGASLTMSDNTAVDLLVELLGGPRAVDDRLADLGDDVTSIDRTEPELNDWRPGETRDTSTPRALAGSVGRFVLGDVLDDGDRQLLHDDLADSATGYDLVRAGVPRGWEVGDKSGTASYGTRNDVAVVHSPGRAPWIVVAMSSHDDADADTDDALIASATEVVVDALV